MTEREDQQRGTSSRLRPVVFSLVVVIALVGAFWAGRLSVRVEEGHGQQSRDVAEDRGGGDDLSEETCRGEIDKLRTQVSRLQRRAATAETSAKLQAVIADGREEPENLEIDPEEPVPWPDDTPELFLAESFRRIASEMAKEAGSSVELLGVDCDEAPCYAALTVGPGEFDCLKMPSSSVWNESYPGGCSVGAAIKTCEDGTQDKICIVGKGWEGWSDRINKHVMERANARRQKVLDTWGCLHEKRR